MQIRSLLLIEKAVSYFDDDPEVNVSKEIGKFYHNRNNGIKPLGIMKGKCQKHGD
jgi:hypothetical protein